MDTLEELKYYCNEPEPVGALMLTGEWGCGKTYLLNNILTEALKGTHIILRVSLFGIESIEEVRKEVKRCWLYAFAESKEPISGMAEKAKKVGGVIKTVAEKGSELLPDSIKTIANGVLSLNAIDFVKIESEMGEKKVVLIFDDLERANISTSDLLGCINDYCENLHINTIVVANEEKIKSTGNDKIKYDEIKEKIIQRTVRYSPDFSSVISNVVDAMVCGAESGSETYKEFLRNNEDAISAIFSGSSIEGIPLDQLVSYQYSGNSREVLENEKEKIRELLKQRPHNIRSLKCALQDFKRIYCLLDEKTIKNKEKWLFTYLSYVLSFRAGLVSESSRYGTLFSDNKIAILYPGFYNDKYITGAIKHWVRYGEWNQEILEAELDYTVDRDKAIAPEDKVRMNRILDLDETDIRDGYPALLEKAYAGEISLNDYVNLLWNCCWSRRYNIQIPNVEWEKIYEGIHKQIEKLIQSGEDQPHHRMIISEENKKYFLPEEWDAYKIINEFLDANELMFGKNKTVYIDLIKTEPLNAFVQTQNKRFDRFDSEMARATMEGFEKASNADKSSFIDYFKRMWQVNICTQDYRIELSEDGFKLLKELLIQFRDKCKEESWQISEVHTNSFIEATENLISEQEQKLEEVCIAEEKARIEAEKKAAEQAIKAKVEEVVKKLLADGMSADEILERLK